MKIALAITPFECINRGGTLGSGDSCHVGYPYNTNTTLWGEALAFCQEKNGTLPIFNSFLYSSAIRQVSNDYPDVYIGLRREPLQVNDPTSSADFFWTDGTAINEILEDWTFGEPNNYNGSDFGLSITETVVYYSIGNGWNDISVITNLHLSIL